MKRNRRKRLIRGFKIILLQLFLFIIIIICCERLIHMVTSYDTKDENQSNSQTQFHTPLATQPAGAEAINNTTARSHLDGDKLASRNAILVKLTDHKVIFQKGSEETIYPASLTKIMTAMVAIENLKDLDQPVELSSDMFQKLYKEDASMAGLLPNETVSARDLLYGILLPSGAECSIGLSEYIAGSEADFVALMNQKAERLGMDHTHFTNCTGLNDMDHYTTVSDLAILLEYALRNDIFREIFTSSKHTTAPTSLHPNGVTFYSTMFKNLSSTEFDGGSILGGKTGYTSEAGLCLASLAKKNGTEYILVTAGAKGNHDTEQYNLDDALYVYKNLK